MRDRAFGVEIECGYNGDGIDPAPECVCVYDEDTGEYVDGDEHCQACCGCWEGAEESESSQCAAAERLLASNGFAHWCDDIHGDGSGVEIPSPILRGREGMEELRVVMNLLRTNGFYTGSADGLHVHHDAPEFVHDPDLVARLAELWLQNQHVIDRFVHPNRRSTVEMGNGHWACGGLDAERIERFKESKDVGVLAGGSRFRALNLRALGEHGTVEFRQLEGTLDFEKARAWIMFGQGLLETAKRRKTIFTCATPSDLLKVTRTAATATRTLLSAAAA